MRKNILLLCLVFFCFRATLLSQDYRYQYPGFLARAYFGVNIGYINYPFSNQHLETGYSAASVKIPKLGVKITLLGYRMNQYLSAQITYMRPVDWVQYLDINNDGSKHSVYMNIAGLTLDGRLPLGRKFSLYGEGGLGIVTRHGFEMNGKPVVKNASYSTFLLGGGGEFHLNKKWDLIAAATYTPGNSSQKQPHIISLTGGFRLNMQPLSDEQVLSNARAGYSFPKNLLQIGFASDIAGFSVNEFIDKLHIFWGGGDASVRKGFSLNYQRNVFHTKKVFALDVGADVSLWRSRQNQEGFFTVSAYPVFRFNLVRTQPADFYFYYSIAGPSYISRSLIDGTQTGHSFTFRDYMGIGLFAGKNRRLNGEVNIGHFSNGNLFTENGGIRVPLSLNLGYTF